MQRGGVTIATERGIPEGMPKIVCGLKKRVVHLYPNVLQVMKTLLKIFAGKVLFFTSLGVVGFFCLIILDWYIFYLGLDLVFINIFINFVGNCLMVPVMFVIYPGLLIISIIHCIHEKFRIKSWSFGSFFILLVSNPFCVGSIVNIIKT